MSYNYLYFLQGMFKLILQKLNKIEEHICNGQGITEPNVQARPTSSDDFINGVNISTLPAKDAYAYALILLDCLFTKEELGNSLMYKSSKSPKPALDEKVNYLLKLVQKKYQPHEYEIKKLISKINQKCRDSNVIRVKREENGDGIENKHKSQEM